MRLIILISFLVACGRGPHKVDVPIVNCDMTGCEEHIPPEVPVPYDEKLRPFIVEFENDAKQANVTLHETESIEFQNGVLEGKETVLGVCYQAGNRRWIRISADWWPKMTAVHQRRLIYHELGHCGLSRDHYDAEFTVAGRDYVSIMNTYVTFEADSKVLADWPVLLDELFNPGKYADTKLHNESVVDDCFVTPEGYRACPITYGKAFQ